MFVCEKEKEWRRRRKKQKKKTKKKGKRNKKNKRRRRKKTKKNGRRRRGISLNFKNYPALLKFKALQSKSQAKSAILKSCPYVLAHGGIQFIAHSSLYWQTIIHSSFKNRRLLLASHT